MCRGGNGERILGLVIPRNIVISGRSPPTAGLYGLTEYGETIVLFRSNRPRKHFGQVGITLDKRGCMGGQQFGKRKGFHFIGRHRRALDIHSGRIFHTSDIVITIFNTRTVRSDNWGSRCNRLRLRNNRSSRRRKSTGIIHIIQLRKRGGYSPDLHTRSRTRYIPDIIPVHYLRISCHQPRDIHKTPSRKSDNIIRIGAIINRIILVVKSQNTGGEYITEKASSLYIGPIMTIRNISTTQHTTYTSHIKVLRTGSGNPHRAIFRQSHIFDHSGRIAEETDKTRSTPLRIRIRLHTYIQITYHVPPTVERSAKNCHRLCISGITSNGNP